MVRILLRNHLHTPKIRLPPVIPQTMQTTELQCKILDGTFLPPYVRVEKVCHSLVPVGGGNVLTKILPSTTRPFLWLLLFCLFPIFRHCPFLCCFCCKHWKAGALRKFKSSVVCITRITDSSLGCVKQLKRYLMAFPILKVNLRKKFVGH